MSDRQLLLIKAETTYGVDPVAVAVDTCWAEGAKFVPKGDRKGPDVQRPGPGPAPKGWMVNVYGELTFDVPLAPSGAAGTAPKWGKIITACGFSETIVATTSVTYALANNPTAGGSVAVIWREGTRLHKLLGGKGMVSFKLDDDERPIMSVTLRGIKTVVAPGAVLLPSDATWTGWNDVAPISQAMTTFSFGGYAAPFRSLSLDQTDNVVFSDRPNQKAVDLAGSRVWSGKLKIGSPPLASLNLENLAETNAISTGSLVHGTVAGTILTLNLRAQNNQPSYSDDKGLDVTDVDLALVPSALNTDDDLSLVLT